MSAVLDAPVCGAPTDHPTCFFCARSLDHIDLLETPSTDEVPVCLSCDVNYSLSPEDMLWLAEHEEANDDKDFDD